MTPRSEVIQRRKDKRFKQWNKTTITPLEAGLGLRGAHESKAFTHDLSLCGAQVQSPEAYAVGMAVRLRILLTRTNDSVMLEGRVKWVKRHPRENSYQIGIEFFHKTPQGFMALMKELFEASRTPPASPKAEPAGVSRNGSF
ncbi:MAG TPA: PilZ domain-containing protein [Acidobacteriota bacterium]|nr:PilZ domain-containing protein [Acidobacteriota bacterium]